MNEKYPVHSYYWTRQSKVEDFNKRLSMSSNHSSIEPIIRGTHHHSQIVVFNCFLKTVENKIMINL